jgi:WD40 repeat protein
VKIDLRTGHEDVLPSVGSDIAADALSPNGRYFATAHFDGSVDVYDTRSLRVVRTHHVPGGVMLMNFSRDSRRLAASTTGGLLEVWDTCDICENPDALVRRLAQESVRQLTPGERTTFGVS